MATKPQKQRRGIFSSLFGSNTAAYTKEAASASDISVSDTTLYGAGMTTVASLMSSGNRKARTRQTIYDQWSMMESNPIVSTSVQLLVTAALGGHETNGSLVFIEERPGFADDKKMSAMVREIRDDLSDMFNSVAFNVAYLGAAFGDAYARVYSEEKKASLIFISVKWCARPWCSRLNVDRARLVLPYTPVPEIFSAWTKPRWCA